MRDSADTNAATDESTYISVSWTTQCTRRTAAPDLCLVRKRLSFNPQLSRLQIVAEWMRSSWVWTLRTFQQQNSYGPKKKDRYENITSVPSLAFFVELTLAPIRDPRTSLLTLQIYTSSRSQTQSVLFLRCHMNHTEKYFRNLRYLCRPGHSLQTTASSTHSDVGPLSCVSLPVSLSMFLNSINQQPFPSTGPPLACSPFTLTHGSKMKQREADKLDKRPW